MQPGQTFESINPLRQMGEGQYAAIWQKIFVTLLNGFWGRFMFFACLILSIYFGIKRRNPSAAITCAILAAIFAFGAGVMRVLHVDIF